MEWLFVAGRERGNLLADTVADRIIVPGSERVRLRSGLPVGRLLPRRKATGRFHKSLSGMTGEDVYSGPIKSDSETGYSKKSGEPA